MCLGAVQRTAWKSQGSNAEGALSWRQGYRPRLPPTPVAFTSQFLFSAVPGPRSG